jgi:hypothetical protein
MFIMISNSSFPSFPLLGSSSLKYYVTSHIATFQRSDWLFTSFVFIFDRLKGRNMMCGRLRMSVYISVQNRATVLFILFGVRRNCHNSWTNILLYLFVKRVINWTVVFIKEYHSYQLINSMWQESLGAWPCLQEPTTGPCPESHESSPDHHTLFL